MSDFGKLSQQHSFYKSKNLNLDMTRGKPSKEQLDLSSGLIDILSAEDFSAADATDCRNYGGFDGLPEAKALFAPLLDLAPEQVFIGGNASLSLMHDALIWSLHFPLPHMEQPWKAQGRIKFLCPCPGYDRHFGLSEHLGIDMIPIPLTGQGPDMNQVEALVAEDASIKGIWCVPQYSNPTGETYSDDTVLRLAQMKTKAPDFRIFWDNAYAIHHLVDQPPRLKNILEACMNAGHEDRVFLFSSTSKISFAGGGLAIFGSSDANLQWFKSHANFQTIGYDKLNQLRHVRFFKTFDAIQEHMKLHAKILRPKFETVDRVLKHALHDHSSATWALPQGGYFINLNTRPGLAKQVIEMAKGLGLKMTPAGSTFPYKKDPLDQNIRISPSMPTLAELEIATEVLAHCITMCAMK